MHVVATAGHVDHGKSTLVRALTGMEPDRWAEERRRGMTIDLGFAWTTLGTGPRAGEQVAFVDVPGHERFVATMLAGVGPVPAVMFVVAADEGWMPQSSEHLAALRALGVRDLLLVVTRADLGDAELALLEAREYLAEAGLPDVPAVAVSAVTGEGLDALRHALGELVAGLPAPDPAADLRLWVDRSFTIRGAGTVVTGTLGAGTVRAGDELELGPGGQRVGVRGLQSLGEPVEAASGVARVALNLRGVPHERVRRGDALLTPGRWRAVETCDVRLRDRPAAELAREPILHVGAAAVAVRVRPIGADTARLTLAAPLPLRLGDRVLLRDPGARRVVGVTLLDVDPPPLARRGAARARAAVLAGLDGRPDPVGEVARRGLVRREALHKMGVPGVEAEPAASAGRVLDVGTGWLADADAWAGLAARLRQAVARHATDEPLEPGLPVEGARRLLGLPDRALVEALADQAGLAVADGRVSAGGGTAGPPASVRAAVDRLRDRLAGEPFAAPEAAALTELGLDRKTLAAAVRHGLLLVVAEGIVLLPESDVRAAEVLAGLPQPFTLSQARQALGTTRRVAVPLLELLDRRGLTRRLPDDTRTVAHTP